MLNLDDYISHIRKQKIYPFVLDFILELIDRIYVQLQLQNYYFIVLR